MKQKVKRLARILRDGLRERASPTAEAQPAGETDLFLRGLGSFAEYQAFLSRDAELLARQAAVSGFVVDYAYAAAVADGRRERYWSGRFGYLGRSQTLLVAEKRQSGVN